MTGGGFLVMVLSNRGFSNEELFSHIEKLLSLAVALTFEYFGQSIFLFVWGLSLLHVSNICSKSAIKTLRQEYCVSVFSADFEQVFSNEFIAQISTYSNIVLPIAKASLVLLFF